MVAENTGKHPESMKKAVLQYIFPDQAARIVSEPVPDCPHCAGHGYFTNGHHKKALCVCVFISGDDAFRGKVVASFYGTLRELRANPEKIHQAAKNFIALLTDPTRREEREKLFAAAREARLKKYRP